MSSALRLLIISHVNGGSSLASPCPGAGTQAASSRPGLWGISPPPPAQPAQPSPASPASPAQVLLFMGEWRVGAHWALGRGAAADTGSTNHSANVLYGDNPDLIPARSSAV